MKCKTIKSERTVLKKCKHCGIEYDLDENWCNWCFTILNRGNYARVVRISNCVQDFCAKCGRDLTIDNEIFRRISKKRFRQSIQTKEINKKENENFDEELKNEYYCDVCYEELPEVQKEVERLMRECNMSRGDAFHEIWSNGCDEDICAI